MPGESIFYDLEPLLEKVTKPIQYVGGELNSTVHDAAACQDAVAAAFRGRGDRDDMDGLTVANREEGWWLNLRASNTEPLLRLNVEARDPERMAALRDEVLAIVAETRDGIDARSTT